MRIIHTDFGKGPAIVELIPNVYMSLEEAKEIACTLVFMVYGDLVSRGDNFKIEEWNLESDFLKMYEKKFLHLEGDFFKVEFTSKG